MTGNKRELLGLSSELHEYIPSLAVAFEVAFEWKKLRTEVKFAAGQTEQKNLKNKDF